MAKLGYILVLVASLMLVHGCKSSCDCYKHSYGHNNGEIQNYSCNA